MTINTVWYDWARSGIDPLSPAWNSCSPNLGQVRGYLDAEVGRGDNLGCHGDRPIRDGVAPSTHSWGAAQDWRYPLGLKERALEILIAYSKELHIQQIHDYVGCRIWRAGRTPNIEDAYTLWWRPQTPNPNNGMGQAWATYLHIETTRAGYHDSTPVKTRPGMTQKDPDIMDFTLLQGGSKLLMPDASPVRLVDTRIGLGAPQGKVAENKDLKVALPKQLLEAGVKTVIVNITLVEPTADGYARVYGVRPGDGSNVNVTAFQAPEPSPAIVYVHEGAFTVDLVRTSAHVLVDLEGAIA